MLKILRRLQRDKRHSEELWSRWLKIEANKEKVLDLHYKRIVEQPMETAQEVFEFVEAKYDESIERAIRHEMNVSVRHKYGKHIYREEDYYPDGIAASPVGAAWGEQRVEP